MERKGSLNNLHINLNEFTNASRVLKQTKSLVDSGLVEHIYIAALHKDGLDKDYDFGDGRELRRFSLVSKNLNKSLIMQIFKYFEFCFKVYNYYKYKNIKIINIHILSLLPLGVFLKYAFKSKLIYDTHELETETNGAKGVRKKLAKWLESKFIKHADMTIVVSESIADWYVNQYDIKRPVVVLNAPNKRKLKTNNYFREQLQIRDDQLILLYQGGLLKGRGVHLVIDAFKQRKDDKVVAVFMGYGPLEADIKVAAEQHSNIYFFPAVPPQVVLEYTASADMGIHLIQNTCLNHEYCMPNKLFEYSMAGLPLLVSNMKDMSELVASNNMGAVISDFSASGINYAIDQFLSQDLTNLKINAYRAACENSWQVQEQKMLAAYNGMFKEKQDS